jgi:COP9 signalosome complex subunit 1
MWTAPHVRILRRKIVERSIVQYVEPFSTVKLETMASAFNISENDMSGQVERLIWAGSIKGRIDLVDKVSLLLGLCAWSS